MVSGPRETVEHLLAGGGTMFQRAPLTCLVTARDVVEVGPPARGEGRLVDRGIKVQALGRGARVESFAETAQSPWTDSALAHWWAAKMDRVIQRTSHRRSCCW
jgi:hypothetical protein